MLRIIISITCASVSERDRLLALWFPCTQKSVCCCWQWEVNKKGERTHQILQRPRGEATQPKLLSLLSCETAAAFKAVLRRDWQQLQLLLSFPLSLPLSVWREPLDGKPRERSETLPSLPPSSLSQRETFSSSSWWGDGCLLWVMCHYDSSTNQCYTGLWQMVEF